MAISVTFLEQDGQRAEDVAGLLAEFLAAARASLHLAIYDCRLGPATAGPVVQALRDRDRAGVDVRIVFDAGKPSDPTRGPAGDPAPHGTADFLAAIGGGVQVRRVTGGDPHVPKLMHHKYVLRDGQTPAAAVWTGSTNFTDDSWTLMENNIVRVDSPELCAHYDADFEELWRRGDIDTTGARDGGTVTTGGTTIRVAFAPGQGEVIDHDLARRIGLARRRLRVGSMLLTSGSVLGALSDCLRHGQVSDYGGIYDRTQMESVFGQWRGSPSEWKIAAFEQAAAKLVGKRSTPYKPNGRHDFMHNKVLVADDLVVTGSFNFSHSATENAENILCIQDPELADRYVAYLDRLARRYRGTG